MEDPQHGMTTVNLNNLAYADEPFVLANDVAQVFYVKDMSTRPRKRKYKEANTSYDEPKRHIVLSGKRDIKIYSVVKFPYVHYVTIICVLSPLGCCIKADTAVLVGAPLILVNRVKCIPVYLVSFPNQYSQRWSPG